MEGGRVGSGMRRMRGPRLVLAGMLCWLGVWHVSLAQAATFTVNSILDTGDSSPGDAVCDDGGGNCTLRAAIEEANALSGTDNIHFSIAGGGPHTFTPATALPSPQFPVIIDGTTEPDYVSTPVIELDGTAAGGATGLWMNTGSSTIRGLAVNRFVSGIVLASGGGNTVEACFIGTNPAGTAALANTSVGLKVQTAGNTIGGTTAAQRNVISGNLTGLAIAVAGATGNKVSGNYIGTDVTGTVDLGNNNGVTLGTGASNNTIGGTAAGAGNVISGSAISGILLADLTATGNVIQGNKIGTNAAGTAAIANTNQGIFVNGTPSTTIGGTTTAARNVISGNGQYGVRIDGSGASGNLLQGNYIGTDINGTADLGNGLDGIYINGAANNRIGGTASGARNVISGNNSDGIEVKSSGADGNSVLGNYIGTNASGTAALGNTVSGVFISTGARNSIVGGTVSGAGNIISGNTIGIYVLGSGTSGNSMQGNYIGTDAAGSVDLGNSTYGVQIQNAEDNTIGGTSAGARNVISGNDQQGVRIWQSGATGNDVQGNYIGTAADGTSVLGNSQAGVLIDTDASSNSIGGTVDGSGNVIANNGAQGVSITSAATTGNSVQGNAIHGNTTTGIDLNNDGVTANDAGDGDTGPNNLQNYPTLTSATLGSTILSGTFNSTASSTFRLEFFSNSACDGSGNGEGEIYLGYADVTTDGSGNATFTDTFATTSQPGSFLTATATDGSNNTSEFSPCLALTSLPTPVLVGFTGSSFDPNATPDLDWGDVAGASTYSLQYATQSDFSDSTEVTGLTASVYSFGGKLGDDTYYWRVRAFGSGTASVFSSSDSFAIIPVMGVGVALLLALTMAGYLLWRR